MQRSGFFNALLENGTYDRKYNAEDYSDNLGAIITTGVRRSSDNDLRVTAAGGFALQVAIGRAWIQGKWYYNDTTYDDLTVPTPPTGDRHRIDRVVLRLDKNIAARTITIEYLTGTPSVSPSAPALTRTDSVYEIALADISVAPSASAITQTDITDLRGDKDLCGWITSPIGYDDFFTALDSEFNDWFAEVKDELASVTLFRKYEQQVTMESEGTTVAITISQYDPTGVDIIEVYANGMREREGSDYTISGTNIVFGASKIAGTEITIVCYKSIDGTGLGSVADAVDELQQEMSTIKNIGDYLYICNGINDNVKISEIAQAFLTDTENDNDTLTLNVYGTFGCSAPYGGLGTSVSRYRWFSVGSASVTSKKRVIIDFLNCSQIVLDCDEDAHYIGFDNVGFTIKNANIKMTTTFVNATAVVFSGTSGAITAENCVFEVTAHSGSSIAQNGTFNGCKGTVINSNGDSYCFNIAAAGLLRVNDGEYYAYTGNNSKNAAVIYIAATAGTAAVITNAMNCPTVAKASNYQKNAVLCEAGHGGFTDTITTLTITKATSQNTRGIVAVSKPNLG